MLLTLSEQQQSLLSNNEQLTEFKMCYITHGESLNHYLILITLVLVLGDKTKLNKYYYN